MKLRHAAALALVGWYLMMAPANYKPDLVAPAPPLSEWYINQSFDTAEACEQQRLLWLKSQYTQPQERARHSLEWACIASDDPRLKGN